MNQNTENEDTQVATGSFDVRHLTAEQLSALGVSHIAYVKPVTVNGTAGFAIHAADGTPMALAGDRAGRNRAARDVRAVGPLTGRAQRPPGRTLALRTWTPAASRGARAGGRSRGCPPVGNGAFESGASEYGQAGVTSSARAVVEPSWPASPGPSGAVRRRGSECIRRRAPGSQSCPRGAIQHCAE